MRNPVGIAVGLLLASAATAWAGEPVYDVVIRNGRVLDGAGNPWISADIAIANGRFVKIGFVEGRGRTEIDATGQYVSPGWIDAMDQSGQALLENGLAKNKTEMGVTTLIAGEDGAAVAANQLGGYFATLMKQGISVNFGTYYGATQARTAVIGDVARAPTTSEMESMKGIVDTAMRQGALGISTALIYAPATFQTTDQLVELAKVVGRYHGLYATHIRDESAFIEPALQEAIDIGERGGVRVEIFHLKVAYKPSWGWEMKKVAAMIDAARERGLDIGADMYPYTAGGSGLNPTVPNWVFADGQEKAFERLRDPEVRKRLKAELASPGTREWTNLVQATGGWDGIMLANAFSPEYDKYRGKTLAEIGRLTGKDPADAAWDIYLASQPRRAAAVYFMMSEDDVRTALKLPWVTIGTDAYSFDAKGELAQDHPRAFGTFPRVIGKYARDEKVLTLPDAIRKMTSLPAARLGLTDRGLIRVGLWADVVVFDYDHIRDRATFQEPEAPPEGVSQVLVNGVVVVDHGKSTGARPGQVIYGPGYSPPGSATTGAAN